ncbi:MAG TPA: 50S ribosomal protein L10 [Thermomicrobiales bacterium]|nr:50S ribosomal protein L10 [Thermomicrobiales bacterium]
MPTPQKAAVIADLTDRFSRSQLTVIADYRGLSVSALQDFRGRIREFDSEFRIAKNTLTRIASEQAGIEGLDAQLEGPTAILFAYGDVVAPAKALGDLARSSRILQVRAGVMNGQILNAQDVEAIASLPPREELLGKLVGMLASPMARTVGVLSGPSRSLAYLVNARIESLGGGDAAEAAD